MSLSKETILSVAQSVFTGVELYEHRDQYSLIVLPENLIEVATELRDNPATQFDMLLDTTGIDWLNTKSHRFEVVHTFYSLPFKSRIRIKVPLESKDSPTCPSLVELWESANWYERETFDMYGIYFENHPDLRRFYMPEDFVDPSSGEPIYPLRKDFPVMGIPGSLPLPQYPEKNQQA
ncbi:MAG: NADH-quinone oxidoreductase subunit C [Candidatus Kapabacteria bacterium]|nr:NADH-quinone oxidoreductase subunit C [Candidatus Kapabacteria bacterium]